MGQDTATLAPPEALDLQEAIEARPTALDANGTCLIHIIRPGMGLGRGNHFYPADMLQENAHKFTGWNVYIDHEAPEAKRARGGLPRSMRDIGGLIESSWWDPTIPSDARHEAGAVVGRLRPIRELKEIVVDLPQAAKFSIKAKATDVQESRVGGRGVWMVEGIRDNPPGSVDAVTEAGAGGRIVQIMEGVSDADNEAIELELAEAKLAAADRKKLPDSAFAIPGSREYPVHDENHARAALSMVAAHGSDEQKKQVRAAVKRKHPQIDLTEADETSPTEGEGGQVKELEEALRDPESGVSKAVQALVEEKATEKAEELLEARVEEVVTGKVDEAVADAEAAKDVELREAVESARQEERQKIDRVKQVADLRESAHKAIGEAELPEVLTKQLQESYDLDDDGEPKDSLDIVDRVDSEGKVVQSAKDQLTEALDKDIQEARDLAASLNPTAVTGQGGGDGGEGGGEGGSPAKKKGEVPFWRSHLEEANIDTKEAFAGVGAAETSEE